MNIFLIHKAILRAVAYLLICFFRILPLRKMKVIALVGIGEKYDDNPKFIIEELHSTMPTAEIVWVKNKNADYLLPDWVRPVRWRSLKCLYEFSTAKVWIANCVIDYFPKRTEQQLYIETWHGGLGVKKVGIDVQSKKRIGDKQWEKCKADVFISNSNHLSNIYRKSFLYQGPIWMCGYPKNDELVTGKDGISEKVKSELGIASEKKILLYAPTWRSRFSEEKCIDYNIYNIDFLRTKDALKSRFGGDWIVVVRYHPKYRHFMKRNINDGRVIDATPYPNMQDLLLASNIVISDYSSCIFDAALRRIPCFTYANDFDQYKNEDRGVYYNMNELPFPYATNNDELELNIMKFDEEEYLAKWDVFAEKTGLIETGHAAKDIANRVVAFINGQKIEWPNDYDSKK